MEGFLAVKTLKRKETTDEEEVEEDDESTARDDTFSINEDGLSTGLKLVHYSKAAPPGSKALEDFLHRIEQTILERIVTYK
eukprot:968439-Ditylum_brightwellii.AAC.1